MVAALPSLPSADGEPTAGGGLEAVHESRGECDGRRKAHISNRIYLSPGPDSGTAGSARRCGQNVCLERCGQCACRGPETGGDEKHRAVAGSTKSGGCV